MAHRVAVTGLGLVSSQGQDPHTVFNAWCEGRSGIGLHTIGDSPHAITVPYALCTDFDPTRTLPRSRLMSMDRVSQLATVSALAAWQDAGLNNMLPPKAAEQIGVYWGTGAAGAATTERSYRDLFLRGRPRISPLTVVQGMHNAAAAQIALLLGLGGDCLTYSVACASSAVAVGEAWRRIRSGEAIVAMTGGAEACLPYGMLKAWESLQVLAPASTSEQAQTGCKPFNIQRKGLVLGEGSAALVLENWDHAQQRGARIYAEIIGYGGSCDHHHLTTPDTAGQQRALHQALTVAGITPGAIGYINAHGTATHDGDPVEAQALMELLGEAASRTLVSSTKSMHGHLLGAAGALEIMAATLALHHKRVPPTAHLDTLDPACSGLDHVRDTARDVPDLTHALSNSFAFGGSNAVLVLKSY